MKNKESFKATIIGAICCLGTLCLGFGGLFTIWINTDHNIKLNGLFDYYASSYGDALCLPLLVGSLVFYIVYERDNYQIGKKQAHIERCITILFCLIGTLIQAKWLISDDTTCNWTIPEKHYFNFAGWYHAVFFVVMFGVLGFLFARFFYIKRGRKDIEDIFLINVQQVIWFSGSLFLFLHSVDDYTEGGNYFVLLNYSYILCCLSIYFVHLCIHRYLDKTEIMAIVSGITMAYGASLIICGTVNINWGYVISCTLLLVILVVPDECNIKKMFLTYVIVAPPSILLEIAMSTQISSLNIIWVIILAISVPALLSILQEDNEFIKFRRKGIFTAVVFLVDISLLFAAYLFGKNFNNSNFFGEIINILLVVAVPNYIKSTFGAVIHMENQIEDEKAKKLKEILSVLYCCVFIGAMILIFDVVLPPLRFWDNMIEWKVESFLPIVIVGACCLLLYFMGSLLKKQNKFIAVILSGVAYLFLALMGLVFTKSDYHEIFDIPDIPRVLISFCMCLSIIVSSYVIAKGFVNNMRRLRDLPVETEIKVAAVIIFIGSIANISISYTQMIQHSTIISVILCIIIIALSNIIIPFFTGYAMTQNICNIHVPNKDMLMGVVQDGGLYLMASVLSAVVTVFFLGAKIKEYQSLYDFDIEIIFELMLIVSFMSWILRFCVENNINHLLDAVKIEKSGKSKVRRNLEELEKHLKMQNICSYLITLPYSIYLLITQLFEYGMDSDNEDGKKFTHKILPDMNNDSRIDTS